MKNKRYIIKEKIHIVSTSPLQVGTDEDSLMLDEMTEKALLPATGIAGAIRNYIAQYSAFSDRADLVFGSKNDGQKSRLFIEDAVSEEIGTVTKRSRVCIDPETGTAMDKKKFDVTALAEGLTFELHFLAEAYEMEGAAGVKEFCGILHETAAAINSGMIRFGGQKTNGGGEFKVTAAEEQILDLFEPAQLEDYLLDKGSYKEEPVSEWKTNGRSVAITVRDVDLAPLLIAADNTFGEGHLDKTGLQNANKNYYIPGSSLKGILRSQCVRIADYKGMDDNLIEEIFGKEGDDGQQGSVFVSDAIIRIKNPPVIYNRIAIDKFTGGAKKGGKFGEQPITGKTEFKLTVQQRKPELDNLTVGILLFAIRDLLQGRSTIGGGFNIGLGRIEGNSILLEDRSGNTELTFDERKDSVYLDAFLRNPQEVNLILRKQEEEAQA